MVEKNEVNPMDLGPKEALRYFQNEVGVSQSNEDAQRSVSQGLSYVSYKMETENLPPKVAGEFVITILDKWYEVNTRFVDEGGKSAGIHEPLIETLRQAYANAFKIDLSQSPKP